MARQNLRAVTADEKAPKAPKSVAQAAKGSQRELLVAMRDRIATAVTNPDCPPRDLASLTKRLADIAKEIESIDARDVDDPMMRVRELESALREMATDVGLACSPGQGGRGRVLGEPAHRVGRPPGQGPGHRSSASAMFVWCWWKAARSEPTRAEFHGRRQSWSASRVIVVIWSGMSRHGSLSATTSSHCARDVGGWDGRLRNHARISSSG